MVFGNHTQAIRVNAADLRIDSGEKIDASSRNFPDLFFHRIIFIVRQFASPCVRRVHPAASGLQIGCCCNPSGRRCLHCILQDSKAGEHGFRNIPKFFQELQPRVGNLISIRVLR